MNRIKNSLVAFARGVMKGTQTRRRLAFLTAAVTSAAAAAGVALATPPSGIISGAVLARAGFVDSVDIKFKVREQHQAEAGGHGSKAGKQGQEVVNVRDAKETVIQQIVIGPGGQTGWHSHPGPAVALIKSGELTLYSSEDPTCTGRTYSAGQAFVDSGQGHVHLARNLSQGQNVEVWVTYFDVPPGGPFRIDAPDPGNCSF